MRIAVDARPLAMPMTGIGRYTQSLLEAMTQSPHQWLLYSDSRVEKSFSRLDSVSTSSWVSTRNGSFSRSGVSSLAYSQGMYRYWLQRDKPDLFWSPRHHLPLWLGRNLRQVVTIHDVVWKRYPETMQPQTRWSEQLLMGPSIKQADKIICVSDFTKSEVSAFWPEHAGKCVVVRSGGGLNLEHQQSEESSSHKRPYALFAGTLEPRKNLRRLVEAFSALVSHNRVQSDLVIVGADGWGQDDIGKFIEASGAKERIRLMGLVSDKRLQQLYCGAHCLAMPSLYEGFGLPVLEAMKFGVPSLISEQGSLAEIAGNAGLRVDPYSVESIANGLESMFNDNALRKSLSDSAILRTVEFSWEKAAKETLAVFEDLADT